MYFPIILRFSLGISEVLFFLLRRRDFDLPVPLLKLSHAFSDQVEDLPVGAPALVFGNVVQLIMQFGVNLDSEMLVLLVSHKITSKPSEYKYILSQPSGVCAEVYLL